MYCLKAKSWKIKPLLPNQSDKIPHRAQPDERPTDCEFGNFVVHQPRCPTLWGERARIEGVQVDVSEASPEVNGTVSRIRLLSLPACQTNFRWAVVVWPSVAISMFTC